MRILLKILNVINKMFKTYRLAWLEVDQGKDFPFSACSQEPHWIHLQERLLLPAKPPRSEK